MDIFIKEKSDRLKSRRFSAAALFFWIREEKCNSQLQKCQSVDFFSNEIILGSLL